MRSLSTDEIVVLQQQGCSAENWGDISVADNFSTGYVRNTQFYGWVELGVFESVFQTSSGFAQHAGLFNAVLYNCRVGNNCYIGNVGERVSNYSVGEGAFISNVSLLETNEESSFGNGVSVMVTNEGGGRDIPICDCLSTQQAYYMAMFRNRTEEVERLMALVGDYAEQKTSAMGQIGAGARIVRCGSITNVCVGEKAVLEGCAVLENGTVCSSADCPTTVGTGVVARDFIFRPGAEVTDGAQIERCFVGEGSQVGEQFAATDCFISCNCQFFHGEAASIFAGPYSVSHHKATLLIAGLFSFMNAGSASNQSNHAYKLGPNHQGILERGSKLASSSYLLWPAHLGCFTTVLGSHKEHPDTTSLPFSYLIDNHGVPYLAPGANLKSVGTMRDVDKWPKRDCRGTEHVDNISFEMLNPITVGQILKGVEVLENLLADDSAEEYVYNGLHIKAEAAQHGLDLYRMAIDKYKGDLVVKRMKCDYPFPIPQQANEELWCDLGGYIVPVSALDGIDELADMDAVDQLFADLNANLLSDECGWAAAKFPGLFDDDQQHDILDAWSLACSNLINAALDDAKKEFAPTAMLGYGLDPVGDNQADDFMALRGEYDDNSFVKSLRTQLAKVNETYSQLAGLGD